MQTNPLISIALCTYNGERFVREQVESLLAQDYANLEVVAVDDASTDGTAAILEACAARDPRLRLFRNATNLGFRLNFERAMGLCRGELIAPSDQDDVWRTDKLRLLQSSLGDAAAAYCDSELIDELGHPLGRRLSQKFPMGRIDDPASFLFDNCVAGHALLLRQSLLERALPIPEGMFHDWWLAFVAASASGIAYCPEPLVQYRQHAASVTDIARLRRVDRGSGPPGRSAARVETDERRLRAFAAHLGGSADGLVRELLRLWLCRKEQVLSPALFGLALRNRERIFAFKRDAARRVLAAAKLLVGLRLKRLAQPRAFDRSPPSC
jgi:hypothetical protein